MEFYRQHSKLLMIAGAIVGIYLFLTVQRAYRIACDTHTAYVYHAATDQIYKVNVRPYAIAFAQDFWNPLSRLSYGDIDYATPLGEFSVILSEIEADKLLKRNDPKMYSNKVLAEVNKYRSNIEQQSQQGFEWTDIRFYPRRDGISIEELLPGRLKNLRSYVKGSSPEIFAGDAVVVKWKSGKYPKWESRYPPEVQTLLGVVFIRDSTAVNEVRKLIDPLVVFAD